MIPGPGFLIDKRHHEPQEATTEAEKYQERVAEAEKLSEGKKTSAIAAESREKKVGIVS